MTTSTPMPDTMKGRDITTPRPWRVTIDDTGDFITGGFPYILAPEELDIAIVHVNGFKQEYWGDLPARKCVANAELIVRAVNAHDDLVKALEASRDTLAALLDALRKEPAMQKREYVSLGIQCTRTAKLIASALQLAESTQ